jgi:hypothetical protein
MRQGFVVSAFLAAAVALLSGASGTAHGQDKAGTALQGDAKNPVSCQKVTRYQLEIYPDKLIMRSPPPEGSGTPETFPVKADGSFGKEFRGVAGPRFRVTGNVKTRKLRVENLGILSCVWDGDF